MPTYRVEFTQKKYATIKAKSVEDAKRKILAEDLNEFDHDEAIDAASGITILYVDKV